MWGPWGLSKVLSSLGEEKGFRIRLGPAMNQCMILDKAFHLSEPKLCHLRSACSDVYHLENCSRDKR